MFLRPCDLRNIFYGISIQQMEEKKYDRKSQMDGRQIIRIGVNFSSETRCIEDLIIEKIKNSQDFSC